MLATALALRVTTTRIVSRTSLFSCDMLLLQFWNYNIICLLVAGLSGPFHKSVKLVLAYAALGCVCINTFICYITSVVMGSGPGESCGGPTTSYTTSVLHAGISSFLESWTWTAITTTTVVTRICNRKKKSSPWQSPKQLLLR